MDAALAQPEILAYLQEIAESGFLTGQIIEFDGGMLSGMPYLAEYAARGWRPGEARVHKEGG